MARKIVYLEIVEAGCPKVIQLEADIPEGYPEKLGFVIHKKSKYSLCDDGVYRDPCRKEKIDEAEREKKEGQQLLFSCD